MKYVHYFHASNFNIWSVNIIIDNCAFAVDQVASVCLSSDWEFEIFTTSARIIFTHLTGAINIYRKDVNGTYIYLACCIYKINSEWLILQQLRQRLGLCYINYRFLYVKKEQI